MCVVIMKMLIHTKMVHTSKKRCTSSTTDWSYIEKISIRIFLNVVNDYHSYFKTQKKSRQQGLFLRDYSFSISSVHVNTGQMLFSSKITLLQAC